VAKARGLACSAVHATAKACAGYPTTETKVNKESVSSARPHVRGCARWQHIQTPKGKQMSLLLTIGLLWLGGVVFVSVGMGILYVLDVLENRYDH
jgi:hypothetical protein